MGQLDMNHALVMAHATIHLENVTSMKVNVCAALTSQETIVKVKQLQFFISKRQRLKLF